LFHISSPIECWKGPRPERHHDFIDVKDFPKCWHDHDLTVEVEAKAKEVAVLKLKQNLRHEDDAAGPGSSRRSADERRDHAVVLASAFWIASRIPIGLIGNTSRAALS